MTCSRTRYLALAFGLTLMLPACSLIRGPERPSPDAAAAAEDQESDEAEGPKPFADVVPEDAASDSGLFVVHRTEDRKSVV